MSVKSLDINPKYTAALLKARIFEVKKLLHYSKLELTRKIGLTEKAVGEIFDAAAKLVCTSPWTTALQIAEKKSDFAYQHRKLTTGCQLIDAQLTGGIIVPGITEISGESASGKTQFCIQLCLCVQKPTHDGGLGSGALYICTEDAFPNKRLYQMAEEFSKQQYPFDCKENKRKLTDQIYIEHAADLEDLWTLLDVKVKVLLSKFNVKLIVIDSIAALFRVEFNLWEMKERSKMLAKFGRLLHNISHEHKVCVVCINQVSDAFDEGNINVSNSDGSRNVVPALGLTWSYFVSTRLLFARTQWKTSMFPSKCKKYCVLASHDVVVRSLKVVHAPHLPSSKSYFIVDKEGVKDFQVE